MGLLDRIRLIGALRPALAPVHITRRVDDGTTPRAVSMELVIDQVYTALRERYPDDYYEMWWASTGLDEDGSMFGVFTLRGKLYRATISVTGSEVVLGDLQEVVVNYNATGQTLAEGDIARLARRPAIRVTRDKATGRYRYVRVISTAILLRGANLEIDGTELHESFIERAQETGEYPEGCLFHGQPGVKISQADYLWRDGVALWETGLFEDTDLARAVAESIMEEPEPWGTSIWYDPDRDDPGRIEEVAPGVEVIVWTRGTLWRSDWLPERDCAAMYTAAPQVRSKDMAFDKKAKAFLLERGIPEALIAEAESHGREINQAAEGMVTRAQEGERPDDGDGEIEGGEALASSTAVNEPGPASATDDEPGTTLSHETDETDGADDGGNERAAADEEEIEIELDLEGELGEEMRAIVREETAELAEQLRALVDYMRDIGDGVEYLLREDEDRARELAAYSPPTLKLSVHKPRERGGDRPPLSGAALVDRLGENTLARLGG